MSTPDISTLIGNTDYESHPAVKFRQPGATYKGRIIDEPRLVVTTNDKGENVNNIVFNAETLPGTDTVASEDGVDKTCTPGTTYTVWVSTNGQKKAFSNAVKGAGDTWPRQGAEFAWTARHIPHTDLTNPPAKEPAA